MTELPDFKSTDVYLKIETNEILRYIGREIFEKLKKLRKDKQIIGMYFTHYPNHIKIGLRYKNWSKIESKINKIFDELKRENGNLIRDIKGFQTTTGKYYLLPYNKGVISDYIICQSFEWLLKLEKYLKGKEIDAQIIAYWFMKNKNKIFKEIIHIHKKKFNNQETFWILERFIHHLLNAGWYFHLEHIILIYLGASGFFQEK